MNEDRPSSVPAGDPPSGQGRRGFGIDVLTVLFGVLAGLVPLAVGLFSFFDPLRGKKRIPLAHRDQGDAKAGYHRVASLQSLSVGGAPQRFPVIADQTDAWNFIADQPIGAVFVERVGEQQVRVFNATCPHAGCSVSCNGEAYHCPCHNSAFNLDGSKRESESGRENPSPRSLDDLKVDSEKLGQGEIWVEFMNFYTGREAKIPKL